MIAKIDHYENERGMHIEHRNVIISQPTDDLASYVEYVGSVGIPVMNERGEQQIQPMEFPIMASSIEDAFAKFDKSARAMVEIIKKEQQTPRIQVATEIPKASPISKLIFP